MSHAAAICQTLYSLWTPAEALYLDAVVDFYVEFVPEIRPAPTPAATEKPTGSVLASR